MQENNLKPLTNNMPSLLLIVTERTTFICFNFVFFDTETNFFY